MLARVGSKGTDPSHRAMTAELYRPLGILLELSHRCPLHCPYCSNPLKLTAPESELPVSVWKRVIREAAEMGVLQVGFWAANRCTARPSRVDQRRARKRIIFQSHHQWAWPRFAKSQGTQSGRSRYRPDQFSSRRGRISGCHRWHESASERSCKRSKPHATLICHGARTSSCIEAISIE